MSRECQSWKGNVEETQEIRGKPFGRDEKARVSKGRMSLTP